MDTLDKVEQIKKYLKYGLLLIPVIVILVILLKGCNSRSYSTLESNVKSAVLTYIKDKNVTIVGEQYIELSMLDEIEGTELCSASSGAIVKNENGVLTVTPYLDCKDYKSKSLKSEGKYITLNGDAIMLLNRGEVFNDPLYTLKRDANVEVDGAVGSGVGVYTINYNAYVDDELKETLYRKVIVTSGDHTKTISGIESMTEPTLTLYGDTEIVLAKGEKYVEPGYKAVDYTDGKITRQVVISGKVDTNKVDSYPIIYSVTNSKGNITVKKRIVNVVLRKANLNIDLNVEDSISNTAVITLSVTGENFAKAILPDGTTSIERVTRYTARSNTDYKFEVYDIYGNKTLKEITVDSIDNIPPSGTCKAIVTNSSTSVTVDANDNKGISGYSYIIGTTKTDFIQNNTYEASTAADSVQVKVKDLAGNESAPIPCQIEKKVTTISGGACGASEIYITINTCYGNKLIRKDVPLEEYMMGVLYGEEAPGMNDPEAYIKAFIIFARTYTLSRIGYWNGNNKPIKSCSSDQNWCDVDMGCYRDQTQEMFDLCIDYAVSYPRRDYTAETCANRVTTFPGSANVSNKTFYVHNSGWWGAQSVTSNHIRSSWHGAVTAERKAFYQRMIEETAGLVVKTADGGATSVHYHGGSCTSTSDPDNMCTPVAKNMGKQGYSMEDIIRAYSGKYPNAVVTCYNK